MIGNRNGRWSALVCALVLVGLGLVGGCERDVDVTADEEALLARHAFVLEAHRTGDVPGWMASEADTVISVNRGTITYSAAADRRARRERYLGSTTFSVYRDLRPPLVKVSDDGTLGWVIAEVEIRGVRKGEDGTETPVDSIWAWIELYEKNEEEWKAIGNVANMRP